jgi:hypothetical protein
LSYWRHGKTLRHINLYLNYPSTPSCFFLSSVGYRSLHGLAALDLKPISCREPAPDQQPDAGGDHTAAMPGGAGQAGAPAPRPLEHPPILPPERRDQGTLCPGRRLPGPPAGKGFFARFRVRIEVKN